MQQSRNFVLIVSPVQGRSFAIMSALTVLKTLFFKHPLPLSAIWMGMPGSSMECSWMYSRDGLEFHHLRQIPSGSSLISVSCAGKFNKQINALFLFFLKAKFTDSRVGTGIIPREVFPLRCFVWLTRESMRRTTASISHPTWIFLLKSLERNHFSRKKLEKM